MQSGVLRALEFDRIARAVRSFAVTPTGAARLAQLHPQTDPQHVAHMLNATTEGVRYLAANPPLPLQATPDLEAILDALAVHGRALEPLRLLALAGFLESVDLSRAAIRRTPGSCPMLQAVADAAATFKGEIADVRQKIEPSGDIVDQASHELRSIRERLRKLRTRLRGTLESYLRSKESSRYLQEQVVTDRNGRYVLVVKAEHRSAIPGIIHGSSASGASLFLEPLSTVEINNEVVALEEQEAEEIRRILLALTDAFRSRGADLHHTVESATELDVIQAKARFAQLIDGVEPVIAADGRFELRAARHPLLMRAVVGRLEEEIEPPGDPTPVDILLTPPAAVLLITGPNTGGKTVALKTAGLLVAMAQAGLHVPAADGSRMPVFRSLFADIGDEQSIAASLSTFSWHVTNIAAMDRHLALPALVLLDEIGAGTDPVEGGALGVAIIDYFKRRGALVVSTTHYDALKTYASTTDGVVMAAFGFTPETFAPNYQLIYGTPGRSLALEIARRLGLNAAIIDAARTNLTEREAKLADHLARLDADMRSLDHERRLVARERETLGETETRMRAREEALRHREGEFKRKLNEQLDERLRAARLEIDAIIADLKRRTSELGAQAARRASDISISTGEVGTVRAQAKGAVEAVVERIRENHAPSEAAPMSGSPAGVGDRVAVGGLGLEGTVLTVHDGHAEVDVRGKRLRAGLQELRVLGRGAPAPVSQVSVNVQLQPHEGFEAELNVIGCTVDEALTRAEKFLDQMILNDQRTARLIHGHGTGQLRRAIAEFLERHPLVARFESAAPGQGGGGVTVVELKE